MAEWQEEFPRLGAALADEYRALPRAQVEQLVEGTFGPGTTLEDAEGFFDNLGKTLSGVGQAVGKVAAQAAPVLASALPGVTSGLAAGAPLGPFGMLGGAILGGLGSALGPPGHPPAPGQAPGSALGSLAGALPGVLSAIAPSLGSGPGAAVGQLLGMLGSPTTQQALSSMLLGPVGARTVPVAGGTVQAPVAAVTNLVGTLANHATAEWEAVMPYPGSTDYLESVDLDNPETRAALLYAQLMPIPATEDAPGEALQPRPAAVTAEPAREAAGGAEDTEDIQEIADGEDQAYEQWLSDAYDEEEAAFYGELLAEGAEDAEDTEDAEYTEEAEVRAAWPAAM